MCQVVLIWSFVFHDTSTTLSKGQFLPTVSAWCELTWLGRRHYCYSNTTSMIYQYRFSERPRLYKQRFCISLKRWDIREKTFKKPCFDFFAWLLVWYKPYLSGDTYCSDVVVSIPVGECCIVPLVPVLKWWLCSWTVQSIDVWVTTKGAELVCEKNWTAALFRWTSFVSQKLELIQGPQHREKVWSQINCLRLSFQLKLWHDQTDDLLKCWRQEKNSFFNLLLWTHV